MQSDNFKEFSKILNDILKISGFDRKTLETISGISKSYIEKILDGTRKPTNIFIIHFIRLFDSINVYRDIKNYILTYKINTIQWEEVNKGLRHFLKENSKVLNYINC
ncbi:hypothetical protein KHQ81_15600 (plasmid) [Mycoplasmatota bacterium]|nr:hypothetical protein KHQ81_15600 [Mycoplasmatota bacterium]